MARKAKVERVPGVVGYVRVSTEEQAVSGLSLAAQEDAIRAECERRGEPLVALYSDAGVSAKTIDRPALNAALGDLDAGRGSVLMVAKLDMLSRSVHDASGLMLKAERSGWSLVALDVNVDTGSPQGAALPQLLAVFGELERKLIGQRTRDALAVKRAQGHRLGRRPVLPENVRSRIVSRREEGAGWTQIARELNEDGVPTAQGGRQWYPATVSYVVLGDQRRLEV